MPSRLLDESIIRLNFRENIEFSVVSLVAQLNHVIGGGRLSGDINQMRLCLLVEPAGIMLQRAGLLFAQPEYFIAVEFCARNLSWLDKLVEQYATNTLRLRNQLMEIVVLNTVRT